MNEEGDDEEVDAWTSDGAKVMLATCDGVVEAQRELGGLSRRFGGRSDGRGPSGDPVGA